MIMRFTAILFLIVPVIASAQNPIVPPGVYFADPAAQVWEDGRLYVYGSVDESTDYYCSRRYHVLSTDDMINWTIHKNSFSTEGEDDRVPYNDNLLFAPDCMYRNGKYFLYYCQPDRDHAEGVAVSDSPFGPFDDARPMDVGPHNQIDPGVFIDDDGTAYYVWGQFTLKMAKLKENMTELIPGTIKDSILTEDEHYFHEGAFMTKHNGTYYLVYADMSRGSTPTCIGYATSEDPMGPYTYRGVIIDNDHSDPQCWNNHGSIAEYDGQWYVFYHRATHNSRMMRKACVEPIEILPDGTIPEVEMTSQGAGPPLVATGDLDAAAACWMFGNVRIGLVEPGNEALTEIRHNDRAVIRYVEFPQGMGKVSLRIRSGEYGGTVQLRLNTPWGPTVANISVPSSSTTGEWQELIADAHVPEGSYALWMNFYGDRDSGRFGCAVDRLRFY